MLLDIIEIEDMEKLSHRYINTTSVDSKSIFLIKCVKSPLFYRQ